MTLEKIKKALEFYANGDNYWGNPLSLEENYCRKTLKASLESREATEVLQDSGELAKEALKGFIKDVELEEKGIGLWIYIGNGQFDKASTYYDKDIGTSDFMEKHYICEADYSKYSGDSFVTHYVIKQEFSGKFPQHVLDLKIGEGDVLCFHNAWQVSEYLVSIMPLIRFYENGEMM